MQIDLNRFREVFLEEAVDHLATLESGLLRLEGARDDAELLNQIFRAAHSIKGSAGMFGFTDVARFTHALEGLLDRLRDGRAAVSAPLVALLLHAQDQLAQLVEAARSGASASPETWTVLEALQRACETPDASPSTATAPAASAPSLTVAERGLRVRVRPSPEMLRAGHDPLLLLRELVALDEGTAVAADISGLPPLDALDPEQCSLTWTVEIPGAVTDAAVRDVFAFAEDVCTVDIQPLSPLTLRPNAAAPLAPGTEPSSAAAPPGAPNAAPNAVPNAVPNATPNTGGADSDSPWKNRRSGYDRRTGQHIDATSIRVAVEKVDDLINLVGELVISQSMLSQVVATLDPATLALLEESAATLERNVRDIQERVMSIRMLPVGNLFARFPRMVHDSSANLGKQVVLELHGEETELDKGVIERLADPLTHLVRNAVDHGAETPEARATAGKPERAVVRLSAFHEGGSVVIEVADDGKGLDVDRIRAKAEAMELVSPDAVLSTDETYALIFRAGFSTADRVSDLSGRGVGMDVVRRNVEALNGTVSISSRPGHGTTFRIKLPLTLAILEGMQLRVGEQIYVLPLPAIVESFRPTPADVKSVLGAGEVVMVRGEPLPLHRLHSLLRVPGAETDPTRGLVVVLENEGSRTGLLVDELLGQAQVVVKSLEKNFHRVEGVTGATIMGDGRVALILDVDGLARLAASPIAQQAA